MRGFASLSTRRGITVLALLLLIIALVIGGFFVVRYLRSRPAATSSSTVEVIPATPVVIPSAPRASARGDLKPMVA